MKRLSDEIIHFFVNQSFVIVSTVDKRGMPHNACKGIVKIQKNGKVFLIDLYMGNTFKNLKANPQINITAVHEHKFKGYCLKGRAKIVFPDKFNDDLIKAWDERITSRLTQRVIKNIHEEQGHSRHPEALLPVPQYMIAVDIQEIIDLTPHHLR